MDEVPCELGFPVVEETGCLCHFFIFFLGCVCVCERLPSVGSLGCGWSENNWGQKR